MTTHLFESIVEVANQGKTRLLAGPSDLTKCDYTLNRKSTQPHDGQKKPNPGSRRPTALLPT